MPERVDPYGAGVHMSTDVPLEWYWPAVDPGHQPLGARVLVQVRRVKERSKGGLVLVTDTKDTEIWNTQVGKVIAVGPLAFRNRETNEYWPEGVWAQVGEFVRIPRYSGDRWSLPVPGEDEPALFTIINDHEIIAKVTMDPRLVRAYIA